MEVLVLGEVLVWKFKGIKDWTIGNPSGSGYYYNRLTPNLWPKLKNEKSFFSITYLPNLDTYYYYYSIDDLYNSIYATATVARPNLFIYMMKTNF